MKKCAFPPCRESIHNNQTFCKTHLAHITKDNQQKLWGTWKAQREAKVDEQRIEYQRLHRFAVQDCIADIVAALKKLQTKNQKGVKAA